MTDRAKQRFRMNLEKLIAFNSDLEVMGDRKWVDSCTNDYIAYMCKKIWMHELTEEEIRQANKAVTGYLQLRARVASSTKVQPGSQVVKGTVTRLKNKCQGHDDCGKHWYATVRTHQENTLYTRLPPGSYQEDLVGQDVEFYATVTVSSRDETFGFAHQVILFKEKSNAS